jgi:L-lactate dehydrogenase complex protein LldG
MSARENILARIRANSGKRGQTTPSEIDAVRSHIAMRMRGPLPSIARDNPLTRFQQESERLKSSVDVVASMQDVPAAAAKYLRENGLTTNVVGWPALAALDWPVAGVTFANRLANGDDKVGVTDCFCAIGETGTLLLLSSPSTPKLHALLPETHICVVSQSRIVPTMEDAFQLLRTERGELPRATFFVSGPSRTADIEQTIVIGAHGPYRVHVIVVP